MKTEKIAALELRIKAARAQIKEARAEEKRREEKRLIDAVRRAGLTAADIETFMQKRESNESSSDPANF